MNWRNIIANLLDVLTIDELAEQTGAGQVVLEQLADGKIPEPRFSLGMRLLDLHLDLCPESDHFCKIAVELH